MSSTDKRDVETPVLALLPAEKRERFERYWREYAVLPRRGSPDKLRLQADIAAGLMLPNQSTLRPSTALAVARGVLHYQPIVGEGLADAFIALTKLRLTGPLPSPLTAYLTYAYEELSVRFQSLGGSPDLAPEASHGGGG